MLRTPLLALVFTAGVVACSSSTTPAQPGSNSGSNSGNNTAPAGAVDASAPPATGVAYAQAVGDPCRGLPLPADQLYVPAGMCASAVALNVAGVRQLGFAPNGDLFAGSDGTIYLLRDEDGDGAYAANEVHAWAKTGGNTNNGHLDVTSGYVYVGAADGVSRFKYDPATLSAGPEELVVTGQPTGGHSKHTTHVYDGILYVHSGSAGNVANDTSTTDYDTNRSMIRTFDLSKYSGTAFDWKSGTPFTVGLRNANGFTRNETTKKLYAVVNGLDDQHYAGVDVHQDNPGEQVVELAAGRKYGYPFCFTAQRVVTGSTVVAPGTQLINVGFASGHDDAWCAANSLPPATFVQAHSAPLDIAFFDQQATGVLPERWRGGAFIAFHGSWDRGKPTGYKVVWQPFAADGTTPMPTSTADTTTFPYEVVFGGGSPSGPTDAQWVWQAADGTSEGPRPAGVAIGPKDGALYIASDQAGFIYRMGLKK